MSGDTIIMWLEKNTDVLNENYYMNPHLVKGCYWLALFTQLKTKRKG